MDLGWSLNLVDYFSGYSQEDKREFTVLVRPADDGQRNLGDDVCG